MYEEEKEVMETAETEEVAKVEASEPVQTYVPEDEDTSAGALLLGGVLLGGMAIGAIVDRKIVRPAWGWARKKIGVIKSKGEKKAAEATADETVEVEGKVVEEETTDEASTAKETKKK